MMDYLPLTLEPLWVLFGLLLLVHGLIRLIRLVSTRRGQR